MSTINFQSFTGIITLIEDYPNLPADKNSGCYKLISVQNEAGTVVNFIAGPETYFVNQKIVSTGDWITGYYDADVPVILIYPPQYLALIIVKESSHQQVKVDFFDHHLISRDGSLQLHLSPVTPIRLTNGQLYSQNLGQRNLIVIYKQATKSIPAQTTPEKVIVYCH